MAAPMIMRLFFAGSFLSLISGVHVADVFNEELLIKPLDSGHVYAHFQFTTKWDIDIQTQQNFTHYGLFPKSLGEVLAKYSVHELHLSLTQGLWRHRIWGYPVVSAPPGAELWAWFKRDTTNIDKKWSDLVNALSGLFCASLNFMDKTATVSPKLSFRPLGAADQWIATNSTYLRYAAMPGEMVCTENLTPWKKLLPCDTKAGLSTFFKSGKLYDTSYHSLGVYYKSVCTDAECDTTGVELVQSLAVVYEPPVRQGGKQDWSFKSLFGRFLTNSCPVAEASHILVDITGNKTLAYHFHLSPPPDRVETATRGGDKRKFAIYDAKKRPPSGLNLAAKYNRNVIYKQPQPPQLHAHRFITGFGQENGGIVTMLFNTDPKENLTVIYMEMVPWFIKMYFHTLKVEIDGMQENPLHIHYVQAKDRQQPCLMEVILKLPANTTTKVSIDFDRTFLKWTEYPPDANHGFYVTSAVVSTVLSHAGQYTALPQHSDKLISLLSLNDDISSEFLLRIHTETLLVSLPTPDFSMPYNVICLACTVVAIGFGSVHNLTTRQFIEVDPTKNKGFLSNIKDKLKRKKKETDAKVHKEEKSDSIEEKKS
ncbi:GPI transamidase component PIG-T [Lingula anatina]|uniref:GPI transamidase component PIG-T n=1 Tax=Lingula anatina TaxID=7574 RepID=A0A1S3HUH2_LINAN|nr:GPI transamidase component PIG-T [Lingula anatina]|eukprot:XP_013389668.1 GPI transamidase component PIG-T [Lingula anatina]